MGVKTTCEFGRWSSRHLWEGSQLPRPMSQQMWSSATITLPWTILIAFLFEKKVFQTNDGPSLRQDKTVECQSTLEGSVKPFELIHHA